MDKSNFRDVKWGVLDEAFFFFFFFFLFLLLLSVIFQEADAEKL